MPAMEQRVLTATIEVEAGFSDLSDGDLVDNLADRLADVRMITGRREDVPVRVTSISVRKKF